MSSPSVAGNVRDIAGVKMFSSLVKSLARCWSSQERLRFGGGRQAPSGVHHRQRVRQRGDIAGVRLISSIRSWRPIVRRK